MEQQPTAWFTISNIDTIDSPCLVVYEERVRENIQKLIAMAGDTAMLRPHVKTHKMAEPCRMMIEAGITKFKCATIAEAEMLALEAAPDVLLAYQPVGPKVERFAQLVKAYPAAKFSCLVDNEATASALSTVAGAHGLTIDVWIDLNTGMNRTGIVPGPAALALYGLCLRLPHIEPAGLHAYDGHIRDANLQERQKNSDAAFEKVDWLAGEIRKNYHRSPRIVAGGSPSFPTHLNRDGVECSPGTFVFWDWGYKHLLAESPFDYAAMVVTRVVSVLDEKTICTDLGHKSVAAENPLPRVYFLNAPDAVPTGQSEEHLVLSVPSAAQYVPGQVLYGVPVHICPTVALYDRAVVIKNHLAAGEWKVAARTRKIHY